MRFHVIIKSLTERTVFIPACSKLQSPSSLSLIQSRTYIQLHGTTSLVNTFEHAYPCTHLLWACKHARHRVYPLEGWLSSMDNMIAALVPRQTPPNAIEFTFDLDRCNQFLTLIACSLDHPPLRYSLIVVNYIASVLRYLGNCRTLKCGSEEKERIEEWNIRHILFMKFRLDSYI